MSMVGALLRRLLALFTAGRTLPTASPGDRQTIERAQREAATLVARARSEAAAIVARAREEANALRKRGEQEEAALRENLVELETRIAKRQSRLQARQAALKRARPRCDGRSRSWRKSRASSRPC